MSIADKITSIAGHLEDDYTALEQLGVSVEDRNIENIKDMANQIYAKFPKTSYAEGSNITLSNTLKGKLDFEDGIVGYGQTSQKSTTGTNLANTLGYIAPTTTNGVTYSLENNIISLNGTATAAFYINLPGKFDLASGNYTFAPADISGTYTGVCGKYPCVNGTDIFDGNQLSTLVNRKLNSDYTDVFIRLFVSNGSSYSNYKCKLNLVKGTYTSQTIPAWEEYSGGYASPNPSYPQEIEVVRGKNICKEKNGNNIVITDELPVGTYTFSLDNTINGGCNLKANDNSGTTLASMYFSTEGRKTVTFTLSQSTKIFINGFSNTSGTTFVNGTDNFQLEKGSSATPYLPYNTIEVVERGKNYSNLAEATYTSTGNITAKVTSSKVIVNGTTTRGTNLLGDRLRSIGTFKKGTYVFSTTILSGSLALNGGASAIYLRNSSNQGSDTLNVSGGFNTNLSNKTFTLTQDTELFLQIYANASGMVFNNYEVGIQIEEGSSSTSFEEYITPITKQLSLGEYEFAKIGNYADTIEYDVDEDKVYKNEKIHRYEFTGQENFSRSGEYGGGYSFFLMWSNALLGGVENAPFKCNMGSYVSAIADYGIGKIFSDRGMAMNLYSTTEVETANDFKAKLKDLYDNGTPCYIVHQKATPELIEITDTTLKAQVKAWYNAQSNNGTTIIEIDGQLPLIIKVRALKGN